MPEVVYSTSLVDERSSRPANFLVEALRRSFEPGDVIAVKLHMGEDGNRTALIPELVKTVVSGLIDIGAKPFLFDSPVVYTSSRGTAEGYLATAHKRGFTPEYLGCPVHVSNDSIVLEGEKTHYELCTELAEADGVCFLTHVKGHLCTGFGGAIKNIAMGGMSKETKGMLHHGGMPVYESGCTECENCVNMCPTANIRLSDGRPYFDKSFCVGCSNCALVCEEGAITPRIEIFDKMLAEAAALALPHFRKMFFINCLINITEHCDCVADSGKILCEDLGYIIGQDIVSVERASFDAISAHTGKDIFFQQHHKSPLMHIEHLQSYLSKSDEYLLSVMPE